MDTDRQELTVSGRKVTVFPSEGRISPLVVLNTFGNEGDDVHDSILSMTDMDCTFIAVQIDDWNSSMSPWPADVGMKGGIFTGGADGYINELTGTIVPEVEGRLDIIPSRRIIAGYSMAGLFSVYSLFRTDLFDRAVSASGSLWFPGFVDYVSKNRLKGDVDRIYLSLGDREPRTRNINMCSVLDCTEKIRDMLSEQCGDVRMVMEKGNHFEDVAGRTARGIVSALI